MLMENMSDAQYWDVIRSVHCLFLSSPVYVKGGAMAEAQKRYYQKKKEAILARIKERYENDEEFRQKKNERSKEWRIRQKKGVLA